MLYSTIGPMGVNSGSLGVAYNVHDDFNFDFVLINLHKPDKCVLPGFIRNGKKHNMDDHVISCPGGPPPGRTWFHVTLLVSEMEAVLSINGIQVAISSSHQYI